MDKAELATTIAVGVLGFLMNSKTPTPNTQKGPTAINADWINIGPGIDALVSTRSTNRAKDVTVRYSAKPGEIMMSKEIYDCYESRHKLISMQLYENGKLTAVQDEDFPYWESNNDVEDEIKKAVCK